MKELTSSTFQEIIQGELPVVVDFWAAWCMPCKVFAPVLEEIAGEVEGKAEFCKLNVDDCGDVAREYAIASIPTVILFKDGREQERMVGVQPKDKVRELLQKHL